MRGTVSFDELERRLPRPADFDARVRAKLEQFTPSHPLVQKLGLTPERAEELRRTALENHDRAVAAKT